MATDTPTTGLRQGGQPSGALRKFRILAVNPGSTSTKISVFENEDEIFRTAIDHPIEVLAKYERIFDQKDFRKKLILEELERAGLPPATLDAVCGRGGLLRHVESGVYLINDKTVQDAEDPPYGEHASNLGVVLAKEIADSAGIPAFFVDPVSTDEMWDVARISGFAPLRRESFFHALNQKGQARAAAALLGRPYEDLNLIVAHMGGGVSIAAHRKGRVVDVFSVKDEGSFSLDRGGTLPVNPLIDFCFSGRSRAEVKHILSEKAGVYSYLGTKDFKKVEEMVLAGDPKAKLVFDALAYQHAKDIGAMAAVLRFEVDAIVLTGGMARSDLFCQAIRGWVGALATLLVLPGEVEMRSLALGALRALRGEGCKTYF